MENGRGKMARLISVPGLASLVVVSRRAEIESLIDHPALDRAFVGGGPLVNRLLASGLRRQVEQDGKVLDAFRPRDDAERQNRQRQLRDRLDGRAEDQSWPSALIGELARYVIEGRDRRSAEAALAYAVAWPFLDNMREAPRDDAYKPLGRHLWRLHRRTLRMRNPLSPIGTAMRLLRVDRRTRAAILDYVGGDAYGLHAVEITLANASDILRRMRAVMRDGPSGTALAARELTWAAIRTAPELVVRQSGRDPTTLPHVEGRIPPHTLVLLRMRESLMSASDAGSGYEFASAHWSSCPARRYVTGLFAAVAETAIDLSRGRRRP